MKLTLSNKIFLLLLFALIGFFFISNILYYKNINNLSKHHAFKILGHDIKIIEHKTKDIENQMELFLKHLTADQTILSSLNLISNYQDKNNYEKNIFDQEKKKLLTHLLSTLGSKVSWSAAFFDKDKDILVFKRYNKTKNIIAYSTIKEKQIRLLDTDGNPIYGITPEKLDPNNFNRFKVFDQKDEILFRKTIPLKIYDQIVGYIRITYIVGKHNFKEFKGGTDNNIALISRNTHLSNSKEQIPFDFISHNPKNTLHTYKNHFITYTPLQKSTINIVSYLNKHKYAKYVKSTFIDLSISLLLLILIFLFITSLFTQKYIVQSLDKLLDGIYKLHSRKAVKIDINSGDEIETIAKEFNNISLELQNNFQSLQDAKMLLENVLNTVPMSIFIKDTKGKYLLANKLFLKDAGLEHPDEIIGKNDYDIWDKDDARLYQEKDFNVIKTMDPILNFEERQIRDNKEHILLISKMPLINSKDETIGILGVYKDITEQKRQNDALKEKEKHLLHQSRLAQMGEMMNMIAHQWRQPLSAVSSTANTLLLKSMMDTFDKTFFTQRLQNINEYSQYLSSTIDDFRNFFKKNKEKTEITLKSIAQDSLRIIQPSIENNEINVIKNFQDETPITTYSNELRQVVLNLLKNSKDALIDADTKQKRVKIETFKENGKYILSVSDNAGGIQEDIIDKVFEPYFSTKMNKNGSGLGLYMSKTIIEEHCKGQLLVQNGSNGAIFQIVL